MASDVRRELEEALRALEDGEVERALDRVLAAWRIRRSPILADVIDEVAERLGAPSIDAPANEWHAAWLAREEARRAADLGALLRALPGPPDGSGKWIEAFQRLERLETWPDDPRLSAGLVELFESRRLASPRAGPFYQIAARLVAGLGDARALGQLRVILDRRGAKGTFVEPAVVEAIAGLERALAEGAPALSPEAEALARAVQEASRGPGPGVDDLLARVYADPGDDGARAAYAEALVARGDPRGEHILLELRRHAGEALSPGERERADVLLRANMGKWLGDLESLVSLSDVRFERGFPVSAAVFGEPDVVARLRGHPAWSTLREIDLGYAIRGLAHPVFRDLRVARGASDEDLIAFATTDAGASLEELAWRGPTIDERGDLDEAVLRALAGPAALPRLRRLRFHPEGKALRLGARGLAALLDTQVVRRVERLGCASGASSLACWLDALAGRERALSAVEIEITPDSHYVADVVLTLGRGEGGRFSALRAVIGARAGGSNPIIERRHALSALSHALRSLRCDALTSLRIEGVREAEPEPEQLEELERAIGRLPWSVASSGREGLEHSARARGRVARPPGGGEATPEDWERLARERLSQLECASITVRVDQHEIALGALRWHPWSGRSLAVAGDVVEALCAAAMLLEAAPGPGNDASWVERRLGQRRGSGVEPAATAGLLEGVRAPTLVVDGDQLVVQIQQEGWTGPHDKGLVTAECGSVPLARLPRDEARFAELAGHLDLAASRMRVTVSRACRFCLGTFSPVDMHDRTVCHRCAERWLGVIH